VIKIENKTFENQVVNFDGVLYVKCIFNRCQLVFTGLAMPNMIECQIGGDCAWTFAGSATNTFSFLNVLYKSGPAGTALVEMVIQMIRNGPPQPGVGPQLATPPGSVN
jgi:hypothetical protein